MATNNREEEKTQIENPCYLKNYFDNIKNIKGVGDYEKCYKLLNKMVHNCKSDDCTPKANQNKINEENIVLDSKFNDIKEYLSLELSYFKNIVTLKQFTQTTKKLCSFDYTVFQKAKIYQQLNKILTKHQVDSLCFKSVYTIILVESFSDDPYIKLIFLTTNDLDSTEEDTIILNENLPKTSIGDYLSRIQKFIFLLSLSTIIVLCLFQSPIVDIFVDKIKVVLKRSNLNISLSDTLINTLPVRNYIFHDELLMKEVTVFSRNEVNINFQTYRIFFYKLVYRYDQLFNVLNETLERRARFKILIWLTILIILNSVFLVLITSRLFIIYSLFKNENNENNLSKLIVYFVFIFFVIFLVYKILKLISYFEANKSLYWEYMTELDKRFLQEECGHNFDKMINIYA